MERKEGKIKGAGGTFYSPEEVMIAYNEGKLDLHASVTVRVNNFEETKPRENYFKVRPPVSGFGFWAP